MIRIFLVEDDHDDIYLLKKSCEQLSLEVELIAFHSGDEFCNYLANDFCFINDIVLLDLNMPGKTGVDVLKFIRAKFKFNLPVIMYTTSGNQKDIEQCYALGANSYVRKVDKVKKITLFLESTVNYWAMYNRTQ